MYEPMGICIGAQTYLWMSIGHVDIPTDVTIDVWMYPQMYKCTSGYMDIPIGVQTHGHNNGHQDRSTEVPMAHQPSHIPAYT